MASQRDIIWNMMGHIFKAHPWHGLGIGSRCPEVVTAFIEMIPTDTVKYEIDKPSGHLRLDRPQRYSNVCPALYGFLPQTYCGKKVGDLCGKVAKRTDIIGDGDPLDICVLTEKEIQHVEIILDAIPIGGLRMIDGNEADDKLIAVLEGDAVFGSFREVADLPEALVNRLKHYFLTYKQAPDRPDQAARIIETYGAKAAHEVIRASEADYTEQFGDLESLLTEALRGRGR